jgi:5-methylcytosine-specific restriction endonuclease McrA
MPKPCKNCGSTDRYANGRCRPCHRKYNVEWRAKNLDKHAEHNRKWASKNAPKEKRIRASFGPNPKAARAKENNRRAKEMGAEGFYTSADWSAIVEAQGGRCLACGKKSKLTVDHIVPLILGGTNWPNNLQGLCHSCNSRKGAKARDYRPQEGFVQWIQRKLF